MTSKDWDDAMTEVELKCTTKAIVSRVGTIEKRPDGKTFLSGWAFHGGDYPAMSFSSGGELEMICGYTIEELEAMVGEKAKDD